jgi:glutamate racemase
MANGMSDRRPIGVMDSGLGGLSIARELHAQLPSERLLYFADQGHVPYGPRRPDEIRDFVQAIVRYLLAAEVKLVVLACNTASAVALRAVRAVWPEMAFVGMEPAVKPAVERTRSGAIGVIATPATFQGELFNSLLDRFAEPSGVRVLTRACPGFVDAVEAGALDTPETDALVRAELAPLVAEGIDELVLGCTHFPFLAGAIRRTLGPNVEIIDPAPAVARQAGRVLAERGERAPDGARPAHRYVTSGDLERFARSLDQLLGASRRPEDELRAVRWRYEIVGGD